MDGKTNRRVRLALITLLCVVLVAPTAGCIGLAAQALYVLKGHKIAAKYEGLKKKRVAIVCVSDGNSIGSNSVTFRICQLVSAQLSQNVKDIEIVPQTEVDGLLNSGSWESVDFAEVGRTVKADMVLAIELSGYSTSEGPTMFKGRSRITSTVYDMEKNGTLVFTQGPEDFTFPRNGRPKLQTNEREFENKYLAKLAMFVAQKYYKHERDDSVENDSSF